MMTQKTTTQYIHIYILRIIAAFFVIFNHSVDYGFYLYTYYPIDSIHFWVYLFFSIFSKVSVPLFFLISGALLLNKPDESLKELWGKRIIKMVIPLIAFSLVYYLYSLYWSGAPFLVDEFLTKLYSSDLMYHLWYMYAYIAYLICIPFLRSMVKSLPDKYFYYMIGLALFFYGVLPCSEYFISHGTISMNHYLRPSWLLTNSVLYPCIGYFLQHRLTHAFGKKQFLLMWGINLIGFAVSSFLTYYNAKLLGTVEKTETFHGCFVLLNCITLFCTAKHVFSKISISNFPLKLLRSISGCTFGIYLMHLLFKDRIFLVQMLESMRANGINPLLSTMIYCILIFAISYIITFCISKIPLLRKVVGV